MPRYTQVFGRLGNKTNDIKYFKHLIPLDVDIVVEPFCGSCACSLNVFSDCDKYNYHFNDTDKRVMDVINDVEGYITFKKDILQKHNEFWDGRNDNDKILRMQWKQLVESIDNKFTDFFVSEKFIRGFLYSKTTNDYPNPNHINIFKKAIKTNTDYTIILDQYKDNVNAFVFLDPPYLFCDNSTYISQCDEPDMTNIIIYLVDYFKHAKCKVMLVINSLKILEYLFDDFVKSEYTRTYQLSKKKSKHLVITNY